MGIVEESYTAYKELLDYFDISEENYQKDWEDNPNVGYPTFGGGSLWTSEGKLLYSIVKEMKPSNVLELGTFKGVSACHIAHALSDGSSFTSVDIKDHPKVFPFLDYRNIKEVYTGSHDFLSTTQQKFDVIWVDDCHEYDHVKKELEIIIDRGLTKTIIMHDYHVDKPESQVGRVVNDMKSNFSVCIPVISDESDCGLVYLELN